MNRILVTGVPGWLGTYFLNMLKNGSPDYPECNVSKDTFVRGFLLDSVNPEPVKTLLDDIRFGDLRSYNHCREAVEDMDYVVHIAGIIHPRRIKELFEINTKGTENLVRASIEKGVKKFIYISSNGALGTNYYIMNEKSTPRPYMSYGKSKYLAEQIIKQYEDEIHYVVLRPCWYHGEGQPERQTKLFRMIKKGRPIILGDGNNLRSLTYIGNLSMAITKVLNNPRIYNTDYWISDEKPYTVNEIYQTIAGLLGVRIKPRYVPSIFCSLARVGDRIIQKVGRYSMYIHVAGEFDRNIACSIHKAKREFGYDPKVSLKEGMRRSMEWCKISGLI